MRTATDAPEQFYRIADLPPPYSVRVVLHVEGREFVGVRARASNGRVGWAEWRAGRAIPVPDDLARALAAYGLWRPQEPAKWQLPLPEPVTPSEVRWVAERTAYAEVEAAELAREMEANRKGPRGGEDDTPRTGMKFWRNPAAITYSPPGRISVHEAEGRLMRAMCAEDFGVTAAGSGLGMVLMRCMADADIRALADHEAKYPPSTAEPFKALPQDMHDSGTALGWFLAYCAMPKAGHGRAVLIHASRDIALSFAAIGRLFTPSISGQRVGQIYAKALGEITDIANGKEHAGVAALAATLRDLRDRNRKAKRGGA